MIFEDFINKIKAKIAYAGNEDLPKQETLPLHEITVPQVEKISMTSFMDIKDLRIKALENQIKLLNEKLSQSVSIKNKPASIGSKKPLKIVDVIADVFSNAEKDLNANEVLERMDKKKLKNKNPDIRSVRASLYYMKDIDSLRLGATKGTFAVKG